METPQDPPPEAARGPGATPEETAPLESLVPPPLYALPPDAPPPMSWLPPAEVAGPAPGYAFGSPGERLVAYIVDNLVIGAILILGFLVGVLLLNVATILTVIVLLLTPIVCAAYFPWFWSRGGQTPGLRLFGLRVVRDRDGGPVSVGAATLRLIGYWIDAVVLYIGFIWIFVDQRKRCWHDLIAGTVVVKPV
jgi:uncharacterized RDD family membrane protein YckC